jgi:peroxiredoxin
MAQAEPLTEQIAQAHASLVYIAAEKRKGIFHPEKFLDGHPISFPFLLDEDRRVTKAYGLHHRFGHDALNIAHPATLVIDRDAIVRFIYRSHNQLDRAPLEQVMDALRKLK